MNAVVHTLIANSSVHGIEPHEYLKEQGSAVGFSSQATKLCVPLG